MALLHLFGLNSFAVAQPLMDLCGRHLTYFVDLNYSAIGITALTALLTLAVPLAMWSVELLAGFASRRVSWWLHLGAMFGLAWLTACGLGRTAVNSLPLVELGIPWFGVFGAATVAAAIFARWYSRRVMFRTFVTVASLGTIYFPFHFLFASPASNIAWPSPVSQPGQVTALNPTPVVMVVFDEFDLLAILKPDGEIDEVQFPNFGRLSRETLWFRNATTTQYRTERAIPAMLTGNVQLETKPSVETEYPDNLFALLRRTGQYDIHAFEPFTRLCTPDLPVEERPRIDARTRIDDTLRTLTAVASKSVLPDDVPILEPNIPRSWFGIAKAPERDVAQAKNVSRFAWDTGREMQFDLFLDSIAPADQTIFRFLHVALPHYPWAYLPDGKTYVPGIRFGFFPPAMLGAYAEDWAADELLIATCWDRYILQLRFVDRLIGQLIDRLQAQGLWEKSLVVVTADHGASFDHRSSRRVPSGINVAEIACVPLFIKPPGALPHINERLSQSVEIIDILPTIADVLKMRLPAKVDGQSVLSDSFQARPRKTMYFESDLIPLRPEFPERKQTLARLARDFGGDRTRILGDAAKYQAWVGRPLEEFRILDVQARSVALSYGGDTADLKSEIVPCYFHGWLEPMSGDSDPAVLAIAVNGVIEQVTRTSIDSRLVGQWDALVREDAFHEGKNDVRIFLIPPGDEKTLIPCRWSATD
jgi:hypothetical protein